MFFFSPLPHQPPIFLLFSQSWPGLQVLFLVSPSTSLSVLERGTQRRPHSAQLSFPLAKHGQKKSSQTRLLKKSAPLPPTPRPAWYSYSVHTATPVVCKFLRPSGLQRHVEVMGRGWEMWVREKKWRNERVIEHQSQRSGEKGKRENATTSVWLVQSGTACCKVMHTVWLKNVAW